MQVRLLLVCIALLFVGILIMLQRQTSAPRETQVAAAPLVATATVLATPTLLPTPTLPLEAFPGTSVVVAEIRELLLQPDLNPQMRQRLEEELAFHEIAARRMEEARIAQLTATVDIDAVPTVAAVATSRPAPTGILEQFPWVFKADDLLIENMWQNYIDGDLVQVHAGVMAQDSQQGIVVVSGYWPNSSRRGGRYPTPVKAGSVRISEANGLRLTLMSEQGIRFVFDVQTQQYVDAQQ